MTGAPPIKALLLDDDIYDRTRIRRLSEKSDLSMQINEVPSIEAMSDLITEESFDLVMIDFNLADGTGLEALEVIQHHSLNKEAAVIMISGDERSSTAVSAFRQGCHDFLSKQGLTPGILHSSVKSALERSQLRMPDSAQFAKELQRRVQLAMRSALGDEALQSSVRESIQNAAKTATLGGRSHHSQDFPDLFCEDEFIFH